LIELGQNRYGKSAIRLVKVVRDPDRHSVRDLTVDIALEGAFDAAHVEGDNSDVIATDTMKNTVYALAPEHLAGPIEAFGRVLARHFAGFEQVARATVTLREHGWQPIATAGGTAPDAFVRSTELTRTAVISIALDSETLESGLEDLTVMKTTKSGFVGFPRDRYTTLPDVADRIMATKVTAAWRYATEPADFESTFASVRSTLLEIFAEHESPSVQASIWIIGRAILERHAELAEIRMVMPNLHHWLVDLAPFGGSNAGEIFVATREPYGLIEATVRRSG
jgi:urate oxidase